MWFGFLPDYANDQLDIPFAVPVLVSAAVWLLGSGLISLAGIRRRIGGDGNVLNDFGNKVKI